MKARLIEVLGAWDGTHTNYLGQVYQTSCSDPSFADTLTQICLEHPQLQIAATWLLKHAIEQTKDTSAEAVSELLKHWRQIDTWQVKLHLLQILPLIKLTEDILIDTEDFARSCLKDENKFVRTWAYQGLYEVSRHIPGLKREVSYLCERGMETESAAVKARIRKIREQLRKS